MGKRGGVEGLVRAGSREGSGERGRWARGRWEGLDWEGQQE